MGKLTSTERWIVVAVLGGIIALLAAPAGWARRPPPDVPGAEINRDVVYREVNGRSLALDLYRPKDVAGPAPVVIWIHSGGWSRGRKERTPAVMLVKHGYAVASIEYRLTRNASFPAQIEDCKAAVRWLRANAAQYRLDPDHIGAWGHSSGGHLAALLGTSGDVPELEGKVGHLQYSSRVQAVCDVSGPSDLVRMHREVSEGSSEMGPKARTAIEDLIGGPLAQNERNAVAASPIHYVTKDDPPFLIIHGGQDATVPVEQSRALAAALKDAGVAAILKVEPNRGHGVGGGKFLPEIAAFFDQHLKRR